MKNKTMKEMTLYNYIQMRIKGKHTLSIVQDLIDDMKSDKELEGLNAQEIVEHIRIRACEGAWEALKRFIQQYKQYCKRNNIEHEPVTCRE